MSVCFGVIVRTRINQRCVCVSSGVLVRSAPCDPGVCVLSPLCRSASCAGISDEAVPRRLCGQKPLQCAAAALDSGEHRRPAAPRTRSATRPSDKQLPIIKSNTQRVTAASIKLVEEIQHWAEGRVTSAKESVGAYRKKTAAPYKLVRARKRSAATPADAAAPATASAPVAEAAELAASAALAVSAPPLPGALSAHALAAAGAAADWRAPLLAIALPDHAAADAAAAEVGDSALET